VPAAAAALAAAAAGHTGGSGRADPAGIPAHHRPRRQGSELTTTVELPVWFLAIVGLLAAWVVLERLLLPGVRWFFRRRVNRVIEEINRRTPLQIPNFALTKRRVLVDRLTYDPRVLQAVRRHCADTGKPWNVALAEVEHHAREIIPAFNAYVYFRWGTDLSRRLAQRLYRVNLSRPRTWTLDDPPPDTSIVFVINHRSNMDYVLLAYLAERYTALSYAVGEWARVWPLRPLVRAMGGYFVRRRSDDALYRRVLERYVQMAVASGVVQAVFPEGGLSRDGRFREPRLGLIDYMLRDHVVDGERDIIFVPVAINYDRVIEDRSLLREAAGRKRSGIAVALGTLVVIGRTLRRRWRGHSYRMGYAAASFGEPVSLDAWCRAQGVVPGQLSHTRRLVQTRRFTRHLMGEIGAVMPALPVPLVAWILLTEPARTWSRAELQTRYTQLVATIERHAPRAFLPRREPTYGVEAGLRMLRVRRLVTSIDDGYRIAAEQTPLLAFYAASLEHLIGPPAEAVAAGRAAAATV